MEILATGAMSSVQDLGRYGYRQLGVGVSGALDALAAAVGNAMLGNEAACAFVEIVLFPFRLRFDADSRIALTGVDARATLDGIPVWPWWTLPVRAGQVLSLQAPETGGVAYLCIEGGIDVPTVMGSRSTDLKTGFGGFEGRALRKGDRLQHFTIPSADASRRTPRRFGVVPPAIALPIRGTAECEATQVRVLAAAEWDSFSIPAREAFLSTNWKVSPNSNRIGARLDGPALEPERKFELLSHGIVPGVIQIPPSGQPIVMQCDAQTSGGYPKIATVIEADQWRVAQTSLGGWLRFSAVSLEQAQNALAAQRSYLQNVRQAVELVD